MSIENEALVALIRARLLQDSRIAALAIDVCSCDGHVSLIGSVDTPDQKKLTVELVRGLIGVRNVVDELRVRTVSSPVAIAAAQDDWVSV